MWGFYPHDEECSTLLLPTVFLFLLWTFKTSFVCLRCHWRALMCTHQHWELCPRPKLSTLSSKSLGHDSVNIYFTFPAKLEYWNLKLLSHLAGLSYWGTPQRAGSWSKKVSTVIICNVMHGSLSNFFHSHTTTATSRTGLWVYQISLVMLCLKENQIIYEVNNPSICNGTGCHKFCFRGFCSLFSISACFPLRPPTVFSVSHQLPFSRTAQRHQPQWSEVASKPHSLPDLNSNVLTWAFAL